MANRKKPRSERKKRMSISIKTRHFEDFVDFCDRNNQTYSHVVEELIVEHLNTKEL